MRAGPLNRRVTVEKKTETQGASGEMVPSWAEDFTVWMSKQDMSAATRMAAAQPVSEVDTVFQARWSPLYERVYADTHRLKLGTRIYKIAGIRELGHRDGIEIAASSRAERDA